MSEDGIEVGYFNLPLAVTQTAIETWAGFDDRIVGSALSCAAGVVERMRKGVFWPPEADHRGMYELARLFPRDVLEDVDPSALPKVEPPARRKSGVDDAER